MAAPFVDMNFKFRNKRFRDASAGLRAIARGFDHALDGTGPIARKELDRFMATVAAAMRQRHSTPWRAGQKLPVGPRRGKLARRSGTLVDRTIPNSIRVTGGATLDSVRASIGGPGIHEFGGTITPRRAKYLTIPLPAALNASGVPLKRSAREWTDTFVKKSSRGNLIIFQRRGRDIVPLYLLRRSVRIPPRLGLGRTLAVAQIPFQDRVFERLEQKIMSNILGGAR